jgi:16S rRNA G966 N2-methylase RsmD
MTSISDHLLRESSPASIVVVIKSPPSLDVRPTSDRLRETLFNILARELAMCASGFVCRVWRCRNRSVVEVLVMRRLSIARERCGLIEANLDFAKSEDQTEVFNSEAGEFLHQAVNRE